MPKAIFYLLKEDYKARWGSNALQAVRFFGGGLRRSRLVLGVIVPLK